MARYFFHVLDGKIAIDQVGSELAGIEEAREEAIHTAGEIIRSRTGGAHAGPWRMIVADAESKVVFSLEFSADRHGL
jgi:hypothetical protein